MEIAFFEVEKWQEKYLRQKLKGHKLLFFKEHLNGKHMDKIKNIEVLCIFVYSHVTEEVVSKLPKLKMICTMSTGYDHIDINFCRQKELTVCNAATYAQNTVAEHTFALILALSNKVVESFDRFRKGNLSLNGLTGIDLKDKIIGIVGAGKIGTHVIRMAHGFGMDVIVYDVFKSKSLAKKFNFKYVNLNYLLKKSDVVSLHCPLTKDNKYMINKRNLGRMKKSVILVNTARGKLIDTVALADAVKKGKLWGVGLDVLENEKEIKKNLKLLFEGRDEILTAERFLMKQKNVIITAHNAFNSRESLIRLLGETVDNIKSFNNGKLNKQCLVC